MAKVLHENEIKHKKRFLYISILALLIVGIPLQLFPHFWMFSNMFKSSIEVFQFPPSFLPDVFHLENIFEVFTKYNLFNNLYNSLVLGFGVVLIQVPISALAAFSLSKLKPKGSKIILMFFVVTLMISQQALLIPSFLMMHDFPVLNLNLLNTFWAVILPFTAWGWSIFVFKGFFDSIPKSLLESARIDGASNLLIFTKIIIPLSKPVFAVVILNTFNAVYRQFIFPLMMLSQEEKWTLMIRVYTATEGYVPWNHIMVMLFVAMLPVLIVYVFCQDYIVEGIKTTGLKG